MNKLNDLQILINNSDPSIILTTKTQCNQEISNAMFNVPGLRLDWTDTMNKIGGCF